MSKQSSQPTPCPFCGNTEIEIQHCHTPSVDPAKREPYFPIGCPECGAWIEHHKTEADAIDAWNTRTKAGNADVGETPDAIMSGIRAIGEYAEKALAYAQEEASHE